MHRLRSDRGAVSVLVAIVLPVVLLGFGALVLDFGALYAEKRQLQNGADGAALGVAKAYATARTSCVPGGQAATADSYADSNANDTSGSNVESIECPASNKVRVGTSTSSSDGAVITPVLAQLLGAEPRTLHATATAAWGAPSALTGLPLTISSCEFDRYTSGGTALAPPPPYPPFPGGYERVIQFHNQADASGCPTSASGADLPGGFGWLTPTGTCEASTDAGGWTNDSTGAPPPNSCSPAYLRSLIGTVVDVPVFDHTNGLTGANGSYHLKGYAAFVLTGYYFTGGFREKSIVTGTHYCSGAQRCIYGFFTKDLTPTAGTVGTGPDLGVSVVQLVD
jgi:Flp pilus assembly protein TadG